MKAAVLREVNKPLEIEDIQHGDPAPREVRVRTVAAGVSADSITISAHCTVCTDSGLFSHRAGHGERQVGFIGVRP